MLSVRTFSPKCLASFRIKVIKPTWNRPIKSKLLSESFWLFVKESFSIFFYDQASFSKISFGSSQTLGLSQLFPGKNQETLTSGLSQGLQSHKLKTKGKESWLANSKAMLRLWRQLPRSKRKLNFGKGKKKKKTNKLKTKKHFIPWKYPFSHS